MSEAFWIDAELDRDKASDGVSRYGAYVRSRIPGGFSECWDGTFDCGLAERFAAMAWRTATAPVMAPPYVRRQPVVLSARIEVDAEADLSLIGAVDLASPWPEVLRTGCDGIRAGGGRGSTSAASARRTHGNHTGMS